MSDEARKARDRANEVTNRLYELSKKGGEDADVLSDAVSMLGVARVAAGKMWVSYKRGEVMPKSEFDRLLAVFEGDVP